MLDPTEIAGFAGAGLAGAAYVPQIWHLIRARCAAGISRPAFALWLIASLLITVRAVAIGAGVFIALGAIQIMATALIMRYATRHKDNPCPGSHAPARSGGCASEPGQYRQHTRQHSGGRVEWSGHPSVAFRRLWRRNHRGLPERSLRINLHAVGHHAQGLATPIGRGTETAFVSLGQQFDPGEVIVTVALNGADGALVAEHTGTVELSRYYPNGKDCDGAGHVGGNIAMSSQDRV